MNKINGRTKAEHQLIAITFHTVIIEIISTAHNYIHACHNVLFYSLICAIKSSSASHIKDESIFSCTPSWGSYQLVTMNLQHIYGKKGINFRYATKQEQSPLYYNEPDYELKHPNHWSIERSAVATNPELT